MRLAVSSSFSPPRPMMTCATARRKRLYIRFAARLELLRVSPGRCFPDASALRAQAVGLLVIQRAHVGFRDGGSGAQHALLAATGARAVAGDERLVIAAHHQVIAQRGFAGIRRRRCRCKGRGISAACRAAAARKSARWSTRRSDPPSRASCARRRDRRKPARIRRSLCRGR